MTGVDYLVIAALVLSAAAFAMVGFGSRGSDLRPIVVRLAVIERKLDLIMEQQGIVEPPIEEPDVVQHLIQGKKILAVKAYRERTGVSLVEAKNAVERIAREQGLDIR